MDYQFWATLDGATKLAPPTSKTGAWVPMIFTILEALNGSLDSTELLDVAVCVALNIMFYSLISSQFLPKRPLICPSMPPYPIFKLIQTGRAS